MYMECASAKATDTDTSAADTCTSAADTCTSTAAAATGMSAADTCMSAAAAAATMAATTATAAAATGQFYLLGERGLSCVFPVEREKCRQAGIEDFLLAEKDFMRL
jgi:hypothetical protein